MMLVDALFLAVAVGFLGSGCIIGLAYVVSVVRDAWVRWRAGGDL